MYGPVGSYSLSFGQGTEEGTGRPSTRQIDTNATDISLRGQGGKSVPNYYAGTRL